MRFANQVLYKKRGWYLTGTAEIVYRSHYNGFQLNGAYADRWMAAKAKNEKTGHDGLVWFWLPKGDSGEETVRDWTKCNDIEDFGREEEDE